MSTENNHATTETPMEVPPEYLPCFPEPLLPADEKFDIPSYQGDLEDLTERRNVKLYNLWTIWSDLRKNEELIKLLEVNRKDCKTTKFLKGILTITMDRMGKVLSDTNIIEELVIKKDRPETTPGC